MPALQPPPSVLVTGASGYLGAWVVKDLLDRGFFVRTAFRTKEGGETLVKSFSSYAGRVDYIVVPDISIDGAYDEAVKDIDAVVHVASPVLFNVEDPQALIGPAVQGTLGLLKSAQAAGSRIKRVVITSSVVTLTTELDGSAPESFDESSWNDYAIARVEKLGAKSAPNEKYGASKTLAERAAFDFVSKNNVSYDVVTVLPSYIFGPFLHHIPSGDKIGSSIYVFKSFIDAGRNPSEGFDPSKSAGSFVDVRDAAALHSLALITEGAGGKRIIASEGKFTYQDIYDALNAADPPIPNIPKGNPGVSQDGLVTYVNTKTFDIFPGFKFRDLKTSATDLARQLEEKGWLS